MGKKEDDMKKKRKKTTCVDDSQVTAVCSTALRKPSYQDARGSSWFLQQWDKKQNAHIWIKTWFCDDGEIKATVRRRDAAGGEINERDGAVDAETQKSRENQSHMIQTQ